MNKILLVAGIIIFIGGVAFSSELTDLKYSEITEKLKTDKDLKETFYAYKEFPSCQYVKPDVDGWINTLKEEEPGEILSNSSYLHIIRKDGKVLTINKVSEKTASNSFCVQIFALEDNLIDMRYESYQKGLSSFGFFTQIGIGRWKYFYENNLSSKTEYYGFNFRGNIAGEGFSRLHSVETYEYWNGTQSVKASYKYRNYEDLKNGKMSFKRATDENGKWVEAVSLRPDGTVDYKQLQGLELYYDEGGKDLVGFRGNIPKDIDLKYGWGEDINGLSCGIGVKKNTYAPGERIGLHITLKNTSFRSVQYRQNFGYYVFRVIIKDSNDVIYSVDDALKKYTEELLRMNTGHKESTESLGPENANIESFEIVFDKPGDYRLFVKRRIMSDNFELVSNAILLKVEK